MTSPILASVHVYPVKSLHGTAPAQGEVRAEGLAHDRRYMLVRPGGRMVTLRELPVLSGLSAEVTGDRLHLRARDGAAISVAQPGPDAPAGDVTVFRDTLAARDAGDDVAAFLARATGTDLRLVFQHDPALRPVKPDFAVSGDRVSFADAAPVLLANRASLDALNAALPAPLPMARFRPNLVVDGAQAWAEDHWHRIRIGDVTFRVVGPCERCVVTTRDPETGAQADPNEPLATLRTLHGDFRKRPIFGQNLVPETLGTIAPGATVEVLEEGPSNLFPEGH